MWNRVGLLVLVVVAATGGVGALGADGPAQVDVETDSTALNVDLQASGTASWEIVYRVELDGENTSQAFADLAAEIDADPSAYRDPFRDRMIRTVTAAENATGREMRVEDVAVETRQETQPQVEYGLLVYRFTWTNFAATDGGTVEAGDAIDQFFLDSETTLRITWPEGYAPTSVTPQTTRTGERDVVWEGQRDFDAGEPRLVVASATPTGAAGDSGGETGGTDGSPDGGGNLPAVALVAIGLAVLAGGVWLLLRRRQRETSEQTAQTPPASGDTDTATSEAAEGPPPELLSNEERVLRLLEDNGGRIRQQEVAEQLDWTAAKTSQVVGDLRDAEQVESFRLGRENVLTLPDVEIGPSDDDTES
jgi:hypothetical protein